MTWALPAFLFASEALEISASEPRASFVTPVMDSALRLLYGPCLASCEPSMVLVWRGYFWMDGLKSTRAIVNCLDLLAASFSSQMTCWSKKKPAHRQSLSAKDASCAVFFAILIGIVFTSTSAR